MKTKEVILFCIMTVFGGACIGIGGTASLLANYLMPGIAGKTVGAAFFSLGLFVIITFEMKLFTGMIARIPTMGWKNWWQLPVCFIGNAIGIGLIALIVYYSFLGEIISTQGASIIAGKIESDLWSIKCFCSAIMCGLLITFSVRSMEKAEEKKLSPSIGVIFPIIVFAFCGFDHSVANMLYLYYFGEFSFRIVAYVIIAIIGNLIGGVLLPLVFLLQESCKKDS